jgi:hypothetical protein
MWDAGVADGYRFDWGAELKGKPLKPGKRNSTLISN